MKSAVAQYDTLLGEAIQAWTKLEEYVERLKVQAQMEDVQRQQEKLKMEMKTMSLIQRMQKDWDTKALKQLFSSLKERESSLAVRLDPLQEAATILSQVLTKKKDALTTFIEEIKAKWGGPLSEQMVAKLHEQGAQVDKVVAECRA